MTGQREFPISDEAFDATLRARHAHASTRLSARTQAQLRQRLRATLARNDSVRRGPGWRAPSWHLATALALSVVVASGLAWRLSLPRPADQAQQPVAVETDDRNPSLSVMDETPDLYVWLASDDADRFVSE